MSHRPRPPIDQADSRLEFETLISDTSAALMTAMPEQVERVIEEALGRVREFFLGDRCALLEVSDDRQVARVRMASYAAGVDQVPSSMNLSAIFPWAARTLFQDRAPMRVSRMADLPPEASGDRPGWVRLGIRSALALPIEMFPEVRHVIVVQSVHEEIEWPDLLVTRLRTLGELLVGSLRRKEAMEELRESEARLTLAADSAEAGLWTLDRDTGALWLTDRARNLLGFSPTEVATLARFESALHPDNQDAVRSAIELAYRERGMASVEYRVLLPDGRERWISSRGRADADPARVPRRLRGVSIDVTARRLAEDDLRRTQVRLNSGAELAALGFYETDYGRNVAHLEGRFRDILGMPPGPLTALEAMSFVLEHIHPSDRGWFEETRVRLHGSGPDSVSIEYRYEHPIRGVRWIQHLARVARRNANGGVVLAHGVVRDITEQKLAEQGLTDLSRRLIGAQEEERARVARELHDDVTQRLAVLAIDVGRAELAARDPEQAAPLRALREELTRLSEDVHSLAYQLHSSVLEELGLVEALRTACERLGRRGGVAVSADLEVGPDDLGKDAALCLFRVAQEALNNVSRHARARTTVVSLRQMDGGVMLAVRDDGVGFDPTSSTVRTNLGIASMRERLRIMNGSFDIDSAPGKGTAILAWVPAGEVSR